MRANGTIDQIFKSDNFRDKNVVIKAKHPWIWHLRNLNIKHPVPGMRNINLSVLI